MCWDIKERKIKLWSAVNLFMNEASLHSIFSRVISILNFSSEMWLESEGLLYILQIRKQDNIFFLNPAKKNKQITFRHEEVNCLKERAD